LETADAALAAGTLTLPQRTEANGAAHKLAGVLGTFGLTKGTILAREAEILYSSEPETDPASAARLAEITVELRSIVKSRK
jgi:HPt (histidine-containing phosphotransfer) domain-containing protein